MNKSMKRMIIVLAIVFGGIILFHLIKGLLLKRFFANFEPPPVSVSSVTAEKRNWKPTLNAVGNFVAINGVEVNSESSGNVIKIHFDSGQYIDAGQPLIDIDDSTDQASLKYNQADMTLKDINYQRQMNLFKRGATSSSSVDEAKANYDQAKANVEKIQAEIQQKHITAPFSGQLGIRQVNLGQYITPGQTSIVTLQSLDPLYIEFNLPEQMFKLLHVNQNILFRVEEFNNALFVGKISAINPKADVNTHNILIQATLPNCPLDALKNLKNSPAMKVEKQADTQQFVVTCNTKYNQTNHIKKFSFIPGMFSAIEIEQSTIPDVIALPSTAISYSLYGNSVFIIEKNKEEKKDKNGNIIYKVKRSFVSTGDQEGNFTIIKSGVKAGDIVVSSGELKLQNGTQVIINNSVELDTIRDPKDLSQ